MRNSIGTSETPLRSSSTQKRGNDVAEGRERSDERFVFCSTPSENVDEVHKQASGKRMLRSTRKERFGKEGNRIDPDAEPSSTRTQRKLRTSIKSSTEQKIKASQIALSPICLNALGANEPVGTRIGYSTKSEHKIRDKNNYPPQRFTSDSQEQDNTNEFDGNEGLQMETFDEFSEESSSSHESPTSPHVKQTFVWSNAAFRPGLLDRDYREDSTSNLRLGIHNSQPKPHSSGVTDLKRRDQESSKIYKEIHEMDSNCSPAVSSNAIDHARISRCKSDSNRQRSMNDNFEVDSAGSQYIVVKDAYNPTNEERDSFLRCHTGPEKPVTHSVAKKVLFDVGYLRDREESSCKTADRKSVFSSTAASQPANLLRPELCSVVSSAPNQEPVQMQGLGTDAAAKLATAVSNPVPPDGKKENTPLYGLDSGIDEIEEEIQRLTKRLAELQLQQAAKRQRQGRSYTVVDDEKRIPEVAAKQLNQKVAGMVRELVKPRQGTTSCPQTPLSQVTRKHARGTSPQVGERRKGWKGIGTISCPQTPMSDLALKQSSHGIARSPQIGEQNKVRNGRVVSAKFLQWDSKSNQRQVEPKGPATEMPGNWVSPKFQRRCVSLGAAASPLKGRTVKSNIADSPSLKLKASVGSQRRNVQAEDVRRGVKREDPTVYHAGQEEPCVSKGKERVRRFSLIPSSVTPVWASSIRFGSTAAGSPCHAGIAKRATKFDEHCRQLVEDIDHKGKTSFGQLNLSTPRTARSVASRYGQPSLAADDIPQHATKVGRSPSVKKTRCGKEEDSGSGLGATDVEKSLLTSPVSKKLTVRSGYPTRSGLTPVKDSLKKVETLNRSRVTNEQIESTQKEGRLTKKRTDVIHSDKLVDSVPGEMEERAIEDNFKSTVASLQQCLESLIKDSKQFLKRNPQTQVSSDEDHKKRGDHLTRQGTCTANNQKEELMVKTAAEQDSCVSTDGSTLLVQSPNVVGDSCKSPNVVGDSCRLAVGSKVLRRINTGRLKTVSPRDSGCVKRMADLERKHIYFRSEGFDLQTQFEQVEGQLADVEVENTETPKLIED